VRELDPLDEDVAGTVFRDVIMLALLGFVALVILLLPHVHPPEEKRADLMAPGNVIVEIRWPDGADADVDLWVQAPGDVPVGYSNRGGVIFDLLRDDLGHYRDVSSMNYEMAYSRGVPEGEYTVNVHMFRNHTDDWPIEVMVIVSVKRSPDKPAQQILLSKVELVREDQEITVFRFKLNQVGALLPSSVNDLYKPLRTADDDGERI
jgi:hypothetical protein